MEKFNTDNAISGMIHFDGCREPVGVQAVRLSPFWAAVRRLCYLLAQKGDPTL